MINDCIVIVLTGYINGGNPRRAETGIRFLLLVESPCKGKKGGFPQLRNLRVNLGVNDTPE